MGYEIRRSLANKSLDELADWAANVGIGSENDQTAKAEFLRRQTALQIEATQAAKETAIATRRSARYMLASVIALFLSAFISALFSGMQYKEAHDQFGFSTRPSIDFDIEDDPSISPVGIAIMNGGPAPATVQSITIYVDRKPVKDWAEAARNSKINIDHLLQFSFDPGDTIAVGEKQWLIQLKRSFKGNQKEVDQFADFIENQVGVEVTFCSKIKECETRCSTVDRCKGK